MYPARALSQILAVQPALDATERDQAAPRAAFDQLRMGQTLTGLVKSQSKGVSLVEIAGQTVAMRLPQQVSAGETLRLRFAGHMPQPVFMLETAETAASDTPQLSQTARMLSDIMQRVPERTLPTLTPAAPLLEQATPQPAELALALRTALVRSGLFYESHLANWAVGQDSLEGLMQEPQNRLAAEAARLALPSAAADAPGMAEAKPAHPLHTLLTQQLQVLETPQFAWRGELWPGQALEWQVRRDDESAPEPEGSGMAQEVGPAWESRLKLELPHLGTLSVHIRLDARQTFSIRMTTAQPATAPLLQRHQARLGERLAAAGCTVQALTVQHDDDAR